MADKKAFCCRMFQMHKSQPQRPEIWLLLFGFTLKIFPHNKIKCKNRTLELRFAIQLRKFSCSHVTGCSRNCDAICFKNTINLISEWSFLTENLFVSCQFDRHESCHFSETNFVLEICLAVNLINNREMWFIQNYFRFRQALSKCKKINRRQVRQPRPHYELSGKLFNSFLLLPCFVLIFKARRVSLPTIFSSFFTAFDGDRMKILSLFNGLKVFLGNLQVLLTAILCQMPSFRREKRIFQAI